MPVTDDPDAVLLRWLRELDGGRDESALAFLLRLNRVIHEGFEYRNRYEDFPEPVIAKARCLLWRREDVEAWRERRSDPSSG